MRSGPPQSVSTDVLRLCFFFLFFCIGILSVFQQMILVNERMSTIAQGF